MKKKRHVVIVGAKGEFGKRLVTHLNDAYNLSLVTSQIADNNNQMDSSYCSLADLSDVVTDNSTVVFLSNAHHDPDKQKILLALRTICELNPSIILLSTLSIYSDYQSDYTLFKNELEREVKQTSKWCIVRSGVIFGNHYDGLCQKLMATKNKTLLLLPNNDLLTGYVSVGKALDYTQQLIEEFPNGKIVDFADSVMSLSDACIFFGFKGHIVRVPFLSGALLAKILQPFRLITPRPIQSIITLLAQNMFKSGSSDDTSINRKFLLKQISFMVRLRKPDLNYFALRGLIKNMEKNISIMDYCKFSKRQKFLFSLRCIELAKLVDFKQ